MSGQLNKLRAKTVNTPQIIFNAIKSINPLSSTVSSIGTFVSAQNEDVADMVRGEIAMLLPEGTLAHKIINGNQRFFTEKQLWVIAFEIEKSAPAFVAAEVAKFEAREAEKKADEAERKAKLAANKEASSDLLANVKAAGRKLADYYAFLKSSKTFAREFYSKKYSPASVEAFLQA